MFYFVLLYQPNEFISRHPWSSLLILLMSEFVVLVLAAMSDGRVMQLEVDTRADSQHPTTWNHINTVQNAMSSFLSTIAQTNDCLTRVKLDSEAKDSILEQLAIAASLLHGYSVAPIHCSVTASDDRITATLSHRGNSTLGHNWTFLMSVCPSSKRCSCKDISQCRSSDADNHSVSVSCDVSGLSPGMSTSLSLAVSHDSVEIFHTVTTALLYTAVNQADDAMKQVSVPLITQVIDILDFVHEAPAPTECVVSRQTSNFTPQCRRLQLFCRAQIQDDSNSVSVEELKSKKKLKEHIISLYISQSCRTSTGTKHLVLIFLMFFCVKVNKLSHI